MDEDRQVERETDGDQHRRQRTGGGGTIAAILVVLVLGVLAFLFFGGYLQRAADETNINVNVGTPRSSCPTSASTIRRPRPRPRARARAGQPVGQIGRGMFGRAPAPRKGMPYVELDEAAFKRRFKAQFADPAFAAIQAELERIADAAWDGYANSRKSPRTRKAGPGYADPDYDLAADWIAARAAIDRAQAEYEDPAQPPCILIINGSSRSEHTCPGEMSKSWRLTEIAAEICGRGRGQGRDPQPLAPGLGIWRQHPPLQGLLLDRRGALPLALLLLPQLCARPGPGHDERDLSVVGKSARHHADNAGELVSHVEPDEADDRPAGLRRRRQSRSHLDPRQGRAGRPSSSSSTAGPIRAISKGGCSRSSSMATSRAPRTSAARSPTGCASCTSSRPASPPSSTAISAIGSPMRPATTRSTRTRRSRRKCATPRGLCWKRSRRGARGGWSAPATISEQPRQK